MKPIQFTEEVECELSAIEQHFKNLDSLMRSVDASTEEGLVRSKLLEQKKNKCLDVMIQIENDIVFANS